MKRATEAKETVREIAELLPRVSNDVKNEMLIILRWENAKQKIRAKRRRSNDPIH